MLEEEVTTSTSTIVIHSLPEHSKTAATSQTAQAAPAPKCPTLVAAKPLARTEEKHSSGEECDQGRNLYHGSKPVSLGDQPNSGAG
jgi:hypothetical protein